MRYLENFKYFESAESKEFFHKVSELKKSIPPLVKKLNSLYNLMGIYFNRYIETDGYTGISVYYDLHYMFGNVKHSIPYNLIEKLYPKAYSVGPLDVESVSHLKIPIIFVVSKGDITPKSKLGKHAEYDIKYYDQLEKIVMENVVINYNLFTGIYHSWGGDGDLDLVYVKEMILYFVQHIKENTSTDEIYNLIVDSINASSKSLFIFNFIENEMPIFWHLIKNKASGTASKLGEIGF